MREHEVLSLEDNRSPQTNSFLTWHDSTRSSKGCRFRTWDPLVRGGGQPRAQGGQAGLGGYRGWASIQQHYTTCLLLLPPVLIATYSMACFQGLLLGLQGKRRKDGLMNGGGTCTVSMRPASGLGLSSALWTRPSRPAPGPSCHLFPHLETTVLSSYHVQ